MKRRRHNCDPKYFRVTRRNRFKDRNALLYKWSIYSRLVCLNCGWTWKSKASFVPGIPDITPDEWEARPISGIYRTY